MTDQTRKSPEELIHIIREIARKHGWAIGVHGSLVRDIDLIAVPWTETASGAWDLFEEIRDTIGAEHSSAQGDLRKPHGRQALMIIPKGAVSYKGRNGMDDWNPPAIDISFVDPRQAERNQRVSEAQVREVIDKYFFTEGFTAREQATTAILSLLGGTTK